MNSNNTYTHFSNAENQDKADLMETTNFNSTATETSTQQTNTPSKNVAANRKENNRNKPIIDMQSEGLW